MWILSKSNNLEQLSKLLKASTYSKVIPNDLIIINPNTTPESDTKGPS